MITLSPLGEVPIAIGREGGVKMLKVFFEILKVQRDFKTSGI
jgi:hypothetical protein